MYKLTDNDKTFDPFTWGKSTWDAWCLELNFDQPVGRGKGSWKGGLMSHSVEMLEGESRQKTVRRYCAKDHPSREGGIPSCL